MSEDKTDYNEFIRKSAEQYLHTVVLIDDRIYDNRTGSIASPVVQPLSKGRKKALKSATPENVKEVSEEGDDSEESDEVSFHDIQNSFAKKRIICSLYQPNKKASFGESSDVYNLCSSSDAVIVDWDLHGNQGEKATRLVGHLVDQSMKEIPYQLRLILIYTLEGNLGAVANKIYEHLKDLIGEDAINLEDGSEELVLVTGNARIVVLGKQVHPPWPQYENFSVPEKELAERTIDEFSRLASGLLQAIVLRGIANIRENNRRIITQFPDSLDRAFLIHRALLLPDEAFCHIIPLLTDELRAVLEDTLGECPIGTGSVVEKVISGWCNEHWKPGDSPKLNIGSGVNPLDFARDVFCNGAVAASKSSYLKARGSKIPGLIKTENGVITWKEGLKIAEYLSSNFSDERSQKMLGSLMSQRIAYENTRRPLHLGVIIREVEDGKRYLLCLQPVCDSVRINGTKRAFIFCILDVPVDDKSFSHIVINSQGELIQLRYRPSVSNCYIIEFTSGVHCVLANKDNNGKFVFSGTDRNF